VCLVPRVVHQARARIGCWPDLPKGEGCMAMLLSLLKLWEEVVPRTPEQAVVAVRRHCWLQMSVVVEG